MKRLVAAMVTAVICFGCEGSTLEEWASAPWEGTALDGRSVSLHGPDSSEPLLLLFVGTDCPISNRYAPEIGRLHLEFSPWVRFFLVFSEPGLEEEAGRRHLESFSLDASALIDPELALVHRTGVSVTPEAALLSARGELLYRGRIDDRWVDFGWARPQATRQDLRLALAAVLAGEEVERPLVPGVGCSIEGPTL